MRILHFNVRYSEGGAAQVMMSLVRSQREDGHEVRVAYGYGPHGLRSAPGKADSSAFQIVSFAGFVGNWVATSLGKQCRRPLWRRQGEIVALLAWADIVHLHAIHSYYINEMWLLEQLHRLEKTVIWTLHDSWILTGRCAIPGVCAGWKSGCKPCENLSAYPPAWRDTADVGYVTKQSMVRLLAKHLTLVTLIPWMDRAVGRVFPQVPRNLILNGVKSRTKADTITAEHNHHGTRRSRVAVSAADLRDKGKINCGEIYLILAETKSDLVTIGRHSPFKGQNVSNFGYLRDRDEILGILSDVDAYLFLSKSDMAPLVILEALMVGTPVLAVASPSADELLTTDGGRALSSIKEMCEVITLGKSLALYGASTREQLRTRARALFSEEVMQKSYLDLYGQILPQVR